MVVGRDASRRAAGHRPRRDHGGGRGAASRRTPWSRAASGRPPAAPRARGTAPEVSVVVSTKNRAASLPALFAALAGQRLPAGRFELVLVDDGSTDDTHTDGLRELARTVAPFPVRVVRRERSGGPASGRNAGMARRARPGDRLHRRRLPARAGVARPPGSTALRAEDADLVQGRTLPEPRQEAVGGVFVITNRVTTGGGSLRDVQHVLSARGPGGRSTGSTSGSPTPWPRTPTWRCGPSDAGSRSAFEPEALLYHDVRTVGWRGILRRGRNLSSHALLVKKHPGMRRVYYRRWIIKPSHAYLMIAVASVIAAVVWTPWALLGLAPYALLRFLGSRAAVRVLAARSWPFPDGWRSTRWRSARWPPPASASGGCCCERASRASARRAGRPSRARGPIPGPRVRGPGGEGGAPPAAADRQGERSALVLGAAASLGPASQLLLRGGRVRVGPEVVLGGDVTVEVAGGSVEIGERARLREGSVVRSGGGEVAIGDGAELGEFVGRPGRPGAAGAGGSRREGRREGHAPAGGERPRGGDGASERGRRRRVQADGGRPGLRRPEGPRPGRRRRGPRPARPARPRSPRAARSG